MIINGKHVRFRSSILALTSKKLMMMIALHERTTASRMTEIRIALVTSRGVNETFVLLEKSRSADLYLLNDVSGHPIGLIFRGPTQTHYSNPSNETTSHVDRKNSGQLTCNTANDFSSLEGTSPR